MAEVLIEDLWDDYSCETCGPSYAEGYRISVDGIMVKELKPVAHCFNGTFYTQEDLVEAVLAHFGHKLIRKEPIES